MPNFAPSSSDPVELLLRRIAQRTLAGSLLTGAVAVTGCAVETHGDGEPEGATQAQEHAAATDAGTSTTIDLAGFDALTCDTSGARPFPIHASGFRPDGAYDSIEIRRATGFRTVARPDGGVVDEAWDPSNRFEVLSTTGERCKTATSPACAEKVRAHPAFEATLCTQACIEESLVTTRGDEVRRLVRADALKVLGPIDTVDEALWVANAAGYSLSCDDTTRGAVRVVEGGFEVIATRMTKDCAPIIISQFRLLVGRDGTVTKLAQKELSQSGACVGRMAAHVALQTGARSRPGVGAYLAHSAQLEAASVHAFEQLVRELEAHGAPQSLIARAKAARDDEVRHAVEVGRLAEARGGAVTAPTVRPQPVRSLEEIAIENAVEGCVRETYGALVGAHQAARATDLGLRRAMVAIAEDEARHAALSHAVHAWIVGRLSGAARARLLAAEIKAIGELTCAARTEPEPDLGEALGLPSAATAQAMIDQLARELWLPSLAAA